MSEEKPKVVDLHTGQAADTRTLYLPAATAERLAEQILISARDLRDENGLFVNTPHFVNGAFEKAPRIALDSVARITGANITFLDSRLHLKGSLAPIHDRPSAFRNSRKRHESNQ